MLSHTRSHSLNFGLGWGPANAALTVLLTLLFLIFLFLFLTLTAQPTQSQTYQVLHSFTGGADGATPTAGVTLGTAGSLYGTTSAGGYLGTQYSCQAHGGCGIVFRLTSIRGSWTENVLHAFTGPDGAIPNAGVVFGPDGELYGTTSVGGLGVGTVFNLKPPATACLTAICNWTESVLTSLAYSCDGAIIGYGDVAFDASGAIYATTIFAGHYDVGTIFSVVPSDGGWTCQDVHSFYWDTEGGNTDAGVIFVGGILYGTATGGGPSYVGTVYRLMGGLEVLHAFENGTDGANPFATLASDTAGNVYGTTEGSGSGGGGTVFEVTPSGTFAVLYSFTDGGASRGALSFDRAGNLYGTLFGGGAQGMGSIFKLTPGPGGLTYTSLHDFSGSDGSRPYGKVTIDTRGNLYGTAAYGGADGHGVVWEITP